MDWSMDLWHFNNVKFLEHEYANDRVPWSCFLFLCVMILFIFSTSDPSNLTNHILEFVKNLVKLGLWTVAGSGLLISMLEKLNWFHLTGPITLVLLMWKWMGLFLRKNHLSRCWGWLSLLNWIGALTLYLLLKENWSLDSLYEISFSLGSSVFI